MLSKAKKPAIALLLACTTSLATVAAAEAPPGAPAIVAGAAGRVPLRNWTVREDPRNQGLARGWQRGGFQGGAVTVPNTLRAQSYTGHAGSLNFAGSVAWYRTSFQAPAAGTYALDFQSANFRADVWVDGRPLGSHRGSYLPFELRASLAAGTHVAVVRIDWRNPDAQAREGFHRTWFNWGGLNGEADLRPIGQSELSEPSVQTTLQAPGGEGAGPARAVVHVGVTVRNGGPQRTIVPAGTLVRGDQTIPLAFAPVTLAHGRAAIVEASATVTAPALWAPSHPALYQLTLAVGQESSYSARVGLRQLSWHDGRIYLNGQRLTLHGATIQEDSQAHGDALSPGDQDQIVAELKAIGANAARSQHPLDGALLERLDAAGILVWQGVGPVEGAGNWFSSTPRLLAEAELQARTAVLAERLHPSVIAWNLVDEVAGNGKNTAEVRYVQDLVGWLHRVDPGRLVAVDVWGTHPPQHAGSLYAGVDAIAETDYSGWYDYPSYGPAQLASAMRARLAAMERTFVGRVLAISEFGAESNGLNPTGAPGGYAYQARLLAEHVAVYRTDPKLSAMLIWLLRDYPLTPTFQGGSIHGVLPRLRLIEGINQKGLFRRSGSPKPAAGAIARLFGAFAPGA